jgi:hypothetical protein
VSALWIGLAVLIGVLVGAAVLVLLGRMVRRRTADDVRGDVEVLMIDETAVCLGLRSLEWGQPRGRGCLALTPDEVVFALWSPRRWIRVERADLVAAESLAEHRGTRRRPFLRLVAHTSDDFEDEARFVVRELDSWLAALGDAGMREHSGP